MTNFRFHQDIKKQNPTSLGEMGYRYSEHKPSVEVQLKGLKIIDNANYPYIAQGVK